MYELNYAPTVGLSWQEHRLPSNGMLLLLCDLLIMKAQPTVRRAKWCSFWDVSWVLKKLNTEFLCVPGIPHLGIYLRELKKNPFKTAMNFFIAESFIIGRNWIVKKWMRLFTAIETCNASCKFFFQIRSEDVKILNIQKLLKIQHLHTHK